MHRRTFLVSSAAVTLGGFICSCEKKPKPGPTPSIARMPTPGPIPRPLPPNDTAAPSSFSDIALWPNTDNARVTITALHKWRLCGGLEISELVDTVADGWCPVVVDLNGPSTWALTPDSKGNWNIISVASSPAPSATPKADSSSSTTAAATVPELSIIVGPAVLDESYAYLTAGVYHNRKSGEERRDSQDFSPNVCAIDVIKVSLSDHTIVASTRVNNDYLTGIPFRVTLTFNADHSSLLIAGNKNSDFADARGFGFRLSTADLSIQFDASTALTGGYQTMTTIGEALTTEDADENRTIVYLATGTTESHNDKLAALVKDNWLYYHDKSYPHRNTQDSEQSVFHAKNIVTSEDVIISSGSQRTENYGMSDPIYVDQHDLILYGDYKEPVFSVRPPGSPVAFLSWSSDERSIPGASCTFGDIVYMATSLLQGGKGDKIPDTLQLSSLSSGQDIGSYSLATICRSIAVSSWGIAFDHLFYPADAWIGYPSQSASPSDTPTATATGS